MTTPSPQQTKLLTLLRELFQLDQPDLDFGLYRIMHAKSREIEQFLNQDLLDTIQQRLGGNKAEKVTEAKSAYERERQNAIDYGGNPDTSPKAMQALAEYKVVLESQDDDAELFDHLYKFFERYYDGGDFLARRYYARATSEKAEPYAVPYDGSEVYLHWANKDQYYIKSAENFRQFSVDIAQAANGDKQLFEQTSPLKLHFTIIEAEEGAHNNVKAASERYFIVDAAQPIAWHDGELTVRFQYRADDDKPGKVRNWRDERNRLNEQAILDALKAQAQGKDAPSQLAGNYVVALQSVIPKGKDGTQTLLAKYLNQYTAKNSMDYFIHKNLGDFLKRELDFYIKNELFRLDDLGNVDAPNPQQLDKLLKKALTLRDVAHKLIEFLAQTEEFQKKLWLKKKFVVESQWLVTLDKVPTDLFSQIEANDAQWTEWEKLSFVTANAKRKELLKPESKLVLDTQFFDADFTAQLLASIPNLDEATDGVLVHSENFQALNLMQARYREQVKCIYIDPPYNTGSDGFYYKDRYQHSSWSSMIFDRVLLGKNLQLYDSTIFSSIDDGEQSLLRLILAAIYGDTNFVNNVIWQKKYAPSNDAKWLSDNHDFITVFAKDKSCWRPGLLNRSDKAIAMYQNPDCDTRGVWKSGDLSVKTYSVSNDYLITTPNGRVVNPPDGRCWVVSKDKFEQMVTDNRIWFGIEGNNVPSIKRFLSEVKDGVTPVTLWTYQEVGHNQEGKKELVSFFNIRTGPTSEELSVTTPKPVRLLSRIITISNANKADIILDYFAGSGTTGHAVISLNREDQGMRKYILVEMGDYFKTVLKPRIAKVIYSADWKDGKPTAPETGISQLVKVIRLESYEDTLNNLQMTEQSAQRKVIEANSALREKYYMHYLLEMETQGSPSLLNIAAFTDPTAYTLNIKKPGSEAQERRAIDLVETFNWLLGLRVSKLHAPKTFTASFEQEMDVGLPKESQRRLVVKDFVGRDLSRLGVDSNSAVGMNPDLREWWFRAVEGVAPSSGEREQRVLVVWRKLTENLEQDNLVLEAYLREVLDFDVRKPNESAPQVVYVNGSHALPAMPQCEVRQLEEAFHNLMWDVQDV